MLQLRASRRGLTLSVDGVSIATIRQGEVAFRDVDTETVYRELVQDSPPRSFAGVVGLIREAAETAAAERLCRRILDPLDIRVMRAVDEQEALGW